ncbi:MAG: FtsW/RodA/SpoVE family cell cycle protein [Defluviitaleaceae bacterium]|nr:FtsW/RodA/SpoVE family cell cycle protein [Defluviitaleaceae bacterium]
MQGANRYDRGVIARSGRTITNPAKAAAGQVKKIHVVSIDYTLFLSVLILVLIGIIMVFSASYYSAIRVGQNRFNYLAVQAFAAGLGFFVMVVVANLNYRYIKRFVRLFYLASISLLILTVLFGIGPPGAVRWLGVPNTNFTFQPSEIATLALILMISYTLSKRRGMLKTFWGHMIIFFFIAVPILIINTSNLSAVVMLALVGLGVLFVASPFTLPFVGLGALVSAIFVALIYFAEDFRMERIAAWRNPFAPEHITDVGFQTVQSLYAIGSGGFFGLGLGQSRQKLGGFLPEAHNDMIFSIIVEELGLLGGGLVLFLFAVFLWRATKIAINAGDLFGSLVATGIAIAIVGQAMINIGVATGAMPNTGIQLPFISYGGTSLVITLAGVGLLLSISRYRKKLD